MKKLTFSAVLLMSLALNGCNGSLINDNIDVSSSVVRPPTVTLEVDDNTYETVLGSYCWEGSTEKSGVCVDTVGPKELVKDKTPLQVQASEKIVFQVSDTPKPDNAHLIQITNGEQNKVDLVENVFVAPAQAGTYLYSYQLWWMDPKAKSVSRGDASYAFAIEVQ